MKPRIVIAIPLGRRLRVVIYCRFSTEEQDASSILDQFNYCVTWLKELGIDAEIIRLDDEELSGELASRPGIDRLRAGIQAKEWDVILCEDSSRLFRNHAACFDLVVTAVDEDIRVICVNDFVDTAEEDWEARLNDAQRHHCEANRFSRLRLNRKMQGLWKLGAAIGLLRPGYQRQPTTPATATDPAKGPFFDEIDKQWEPVIYEAYERIARNDTSWLVAEWLTSTGLPKCTNSTTSGWSERDAIALIRRSIYRGFDEYRRTITRRKKKTGKKRVKKGMPEEVWSRDMPHLRIVPDWLWYKANEVINQRTKRKKHLSGSDHPLTGLSRDSRGPLSKIFVCGAGGHKMHAEGRAEGGYRCSKARKGDCWMKATAYRQLTHERISEAVANNIIATCGGIDTLLDIAGEKSLDDTGLRLELRQLQQQQHDFEAKCRRLGAAIELQDPAPVTLVQQLAEREHELCLVRAKSEEVVAKLKERRDPPSREEVERCLKAAAAKLLDMDREAGVILAQLLDGPIRAVPYQQFGSNNVVLRAEFRICLTKLLPEQLRACLDDPHVIPANPALEPVNITVNLFKMCGAAEHAIKAATLAIEEHLTLVQIAKRLNVSKRTAHRAKQLGIKLMEAGLNDPYIRLTEPPAGASRWRTRKRLGQADERRAG